MHAPALSRPSGPRRERGVVLILAIIVLVAMSLAALALMRSVLTGNRVAGNLAFQQSATLAADQGVEGAAAWLEQNRVGNKLFNDVDASATDNGYFATRSDPAAGQSWDAWWAGLAAKQMNTLAPDAAGNTVSYFIHRLCRVTGDPANNIGCEIAAKSDPGKGGSMTCCEKPKGAAVQYYYRVTTRVTGARGTSSYVQAIVTM